MCLQSAVASPADDGYDVVCSSAWPDLAQKAISEILNVPYNRSDI